MNQSLADVVCLARYPLGSGEFRAECKRSLDENGVLVFGSFLQPAAIDSIRREGERNQHLAYYTASDHNIYLKPTDTNFADNHPRNRSVTSSKGCITSDQIPTESVLHTLYDAPEFRQFLCSVLGETRLYEYADSLSSINLHYASEGQELGWHFDNSSFAITLMIQTAEDGGAFEFVKDIRDADGGEMNYGLSAEVLDGKTATKTLSMEPGALVLFRGRNSIHRVTPTKGERTRMLVVLAYNTEPGIALSESARITFYGRLD